MLLRWIPLLALLLAACPGMALRHSATTAVVPVAAGVYELEFQGGELRVLRDGRLSCIAPAAQPLPYAIIAPGPPALVTVCGPDLVPTTYAAADPVVAYRDMLPLVCDPPLVALMPLPDLETFLPVGCTLLKPDGGVLWTAAECELVAAECGVHDSGVAYIAQAKDGTALAAFGYPSLAAIDTRSGEPLWAVALDAKGETVEVALWALDAKHGLLSLQYGYDAYEFFVFDRATGKLGPRHALKGQPATRVVYPGAADEATWVRLNGARAEMLIYPANGPAQIWSFKLADGSLVKKAWEEKLPVPRREENPLSVGGSGAPDPKQPPFAQQMLPAQSGADWRIPALADAQGRVLVIDAAGARWAELPAK
jgi:hypothetical protein